MNRLLVKLLCRHLSWGQFLGFFLSNLLGMTIVLLSWQFYIDISPVFTSGDSFMQPSYMVIGKKVTSVQTFMGSRPRFSEWEITDIQHQPFVDGVGCFVPALFDVYASIENRELGVGLSTEMFFEAIPDEYVDIDLSRWHYETGSDTLPIVLPRSYLNLYNFGFASSRGLPVLSESMIGMIQLRFRLRGSRGERQMYGKVVDFSNRLNSILVPWNFMHETNVALSPHRQPDCSRLVLKVNHSADEQMAMYFAAHHYEEEGRGADTGRMTYFLHLMVGLVISIGLVICVLSFYVLLLSIYLLLQKNTDKIDTLLLMGYSRGSVALPFYLLSFLLNLFVLIFSYLTVWGLRSSYLAQISVVYPHLSPASIDSTLVGGLLLCLTVTGLNYMAVRRKVNGIWFRNMDK